MNAVWAVQDRTLSDGRGSDGLILEVHESAARRGGGANRRFGVNRDRVATITAIDGDALMALPP
jgi:hypothetical protein